MYSNQHIQAYVRAFPEPESEVLRAARARSEEADIPNVAPQTGALLRFLARVTRARYAVEVGSGGGYSGLWLLGGMDPKGSLTTIEISPAHQALAQRAFTEAKVADRIRSILGAALAVLPKLSDSSYDLVFLDAVKAEYPEYLVHAKRLLHPGGLLLADNVMWDGRVSDPDVSDEDTTALREFNDTVADDPDWHGLIFNVGDGVLGAVYDPR
ncbi:MAG: O-methyltransferase [Egibacteraceae bacterium]